MFKRVILTVLLALSCVLSLPVLATDNVLVASIAKEFKKDAKSIATIVKIVDEEIALKKEKSPFLTRSLVLGVIAVESRFDPNAKHLGSLGLMQILQSVHHISDPYSARNNIRKGIDILCTYYELVHGSVRNTLLAYNAGIGSFQKGRYRAQYAVKVLNWKKEMEKWEASSSEV